MQVSGSPVTAGCQHVPFRLVRLHQNRLFEEHQRLFDHLHFDVVRTQPVHGQQIAGIVTKRLQRNKIDLTGFWGSELELTSE